MIDNISDKIKINLLKMLNYNIKIDDELKSLSSDEIEEIIFLCKRHHIKEYLYYNLKKNDLLSLLSQEQIKDLEDSFKQKTFYNMSLLAELKNISKEFKKDNIPLIALKGLHLIQDIYPHIALRYSRDLDILVPKNKGKASYETSKRLDYYCDKKLTEYDYSFKYHHHLHQFFNSKKGFILELHAHLSEQIHINTNRLWQNSKEEKLDLEDLIIHLSIHMSYSDIFKNDLRHYLDLYVVLEELKDDINWKIVKQRAEDDKCLEGIYLMFKIIGILFSITLPKEVESFYSYTSQREQIVNNAIDFMWLYDKSSQDYVFYRAQNISITQRNSLFKKVLSRIFIPKHELAYIYSQEKNSKKIYIYYFIRFYDLIKRHTFKIIGINTNDSKKKFVEKTLFVYNYLNKGK
ncbi:MAG: nucleotidyltransferase family protein [Halarcobacter sp.]